MARIAERLRDAIESAAVRLNRRLSDFDWFLNANNGALTRAFKIPHPVSALLLLSLVCWVAIHGPILPQLRFDLKIFFLRHLPILRQFRGWGELLVCIGATVGIILILRMPRRRADPLVTQPILILVLLGLVYVCADPAAAASSNSLYRHVFMPVIAGVALSAMLLPRALASSFIRIYKRHYQPEKINLPPLNTLLGKAQFLVEKPPPEAGALQLFLSLLTPFYYPFRLLFPVAIAVLIAPYGEFAVYGADFVHLLILLLIVAVAVAALLFHDGTMSMAAFKRSAAAASIVMIPASIFFICFRFHPIHVHFMTVYAVLFGITAWITLTAAGIDPALNASLKLSSRLFFSGGKWALSLGVVALAFFRYIQVDYVSTVLNSRSKAVIFGYITAAYAILWLYDYWIDRTMAEKLLPLLIPTSADIKEKIRYRAPIDPADQSSERRGRCIEIYGGGRFAVVLPPLKREGRGSARTQFEAHSLSNFFYRVVYGANPGVDPALIEKAYGVDRLKRFVRFYTLSLNAVPFIVGALVISLAHRDSDAELEAKISPRPPAAMAYGGLRESIFSPAQNESPRRVILLCGSGGGTRAALYTASVLRGLYTHQSLDKVVALSGVSGGSAAIAYYSIHRDELMRGDASAEIAWRKYFHTMAAPFIDDVLGGMSELRTCGGTRTGILLRDSFIKRMESAQPGAIRTIGQAPVGLIFNTTRAGEQEWSSGNLATATSAGAGAPLIFSNIDPASFEHCGHREAPSLCLSSRSICDPDVPLTAAAALSANFPPVFANAAVDVASGANRTRYWVTDGGASENRGIISLLYALRFALSQELAELFVSADPKPRALPEIHIIVADASAEDTSFVQDRGLNSALCAADNYANQLGLELTAQINELCRELHSKAGAKSKDCSVHFHYLGMPDVLRVTGSVGTHWMLAGTYALHHKEKNGAAGDHTVLRGRSVEALIADLHVNGNPTPSTRDKSEQTEQQKVRGWIRADGYDAAWQKTIEDITGQSNRTE